MILAMSKTTAPRTLAWSGEVLRELRDARGWTQSRLRDEMMAAGGGPSHPNQISDWEAGMQPAARFLAVLCGLFDVSPARFYSDGG
jgi:transcriptional regulator with XRE-family HTH domain